MIARSIAMKLRGRCGVRLWVLGRLRTKPSFSTHFVEAGAHRGPAAGDRAGVSAIDLRVDGVPRVRGAVQDAEDVLRGHPCHAGHRFGRHPRHVRGGDDGIERQQRVIDRGWLQIEHIEPDLTLDGLCMLAERNPAPVMPRERTRLIETE